MGDLAWDLRDPRPWAQISWAGSIRRLAVKFIVGRAALALLIFCPAALRYYVPTTLLVAIGDAHITAGHSGAEAKAGLLLHAAGGAAILVLSAVLWCDEKLSSAQ